MVNIVSGADDSAAAVADGLICTANESASLEPVPAKEASLACDRRKPRLPRVAPPGACIKCKVERAVVRARQVDYCCLCFFTALDTRVRTSIARARASLAKSDDIENGKPATNSADWPVVFAYSGGFCSSSLLQIVAAQSLAQPRSHLPQNQTELPKWYSEFTMTHSVLGPIAEIVYVSQEPLFPKPSKDEIAILKDFVENCSFVPKLKLTVIDLVDVSELVSRISICNEESEKLPQGSKISNHGKLPRVLCRFLNHLTTKCNLGTVEKTDSICKNTRKTENENASDADANSNAGFSQATRYDDIGRQVKRDLLDILFTRRLLQHASRIAATHGSQGARLVTADSATRLAARTLRLVMSGAGAAAMTLAAGGAMRWTPICGDTPKVILERPLVQNTASECALYLHHSRITAPLPESTQTAMHGIGGGTRTREMLASVDRERPGSDGTVLRTIEKVGLVGETIGVAKNEICCDLCLLLPAEAENPCPTANNEDCALCYRCCKLMRALH